MDATNEQDLYRIGTVASLTGIAVERLRAWERRYALSPAHKAGKTRFYSKPQLDQLKLIKHLIDQGQPISSLANLTLEQLEERISSQPSEPVVLSLHALKVGLVGPSLVMLEQQMLKADQMPGARSRIEVVSRWANIEAFFAERSDADSPQALVMQLPVLSTQVIDKIKKIYPSAKIIAVYQFATAEDISAVQEQGTPTLKWPISWAELEYTAVSESGTPIRAGRALPRRYSDEELIAIAANSEDATQCPQYLIEAINQLNDFATYAQSCAERAGHGHRYRSIQEDSTQARAQLELALESLISANKHIDVAQA